jgi:predicted adenylyl cyclase CyaB
MQETADKNSHFEVERKFSISENEYIALPEKLKKLGFVFVRRASMHDTFLPTMNAGDMSRIRVETIGDVTTTVFTRKTWETVAGTRERKETPDEVLGVNTTAVLLELGRRLNGPELLSFSKVRNEYQRHADDLNVTVALDKAEDLGKYSGYYMEIEVLVTTNGEVEPARRCIDSLVATLLGEKRADVQLSYMEMLVQTAL